MSSNSPLLIGFACDYLSLCVLGQDLVASNKGLKIFEKNGVPYRATDNVGPNGKRIPVPIPDTEKGGKAEIALEKASELESQKAAPAMQEALELLSSGGAFTAELVTKVATDSEVRKRLGLTAGYALGEMAQKLNQLTIDNPSLDKLLGSAVDGLDIELAKEFGDDKTPFAQAMRLGSTPTPEKDTPLLDRLSFQLTKAKLLTHVVAEPQKYSEYKTKRNAALKKIGHAALNSLALLAIAAGPDVAYPLLSQMELPILNAVMVRTEIHLMSILKSWFIGAKVDELAFEPLVEKMDIKDPKLNFLVRFGLSMTMTHFFYKYGVEELIDHAGESLLHGIKGNAKLLTAKLGKKDLALLTELAKK